MIDFMWNIHQEGRIAEAQSDASRAKDEVTTYKKQIRDLEFSLNRMALVSRLKTSSGRRRDVMKGSYKVRVPHV